MPGGIEGNSAGDTIIRRFKVDARSSLDGLLHLLAVLGAGVEPGESLFHACLEGLGLR